MTNITLVFDKLGLDAEARTIIMRRRESINLFLMRLVENKDYKFLGFTLDDSELRQQLQTVIFKIDSHMYFLLGKELGFVDTTLRRIYSRCWRSEMLSRTIWPRYQSVHKEMREAILDDIERQFSAILVTSPNITDWIKAFSQQGICRDSAAARRIAYELDRVENFVINIAQDLMLSWCELTDLGLLKHSDYPCFNELMILQREESSLAEVRPEAASILGVLRSDLIALYRAFHHTDFLKAYHASYGEDAKPWNQSLLHQPQDVAVRRDAILKIAPLRHLLIPILSDLRGCTQAEANSMVDALLYSGLRKLIELRCGDRDTAVGIAREREKLIKVARNQLGFINDAKYEQILRRLVSLHEAIITSNTTFPLQNLLRHLPSSGYRKKRQRQEVPEALIAAFAAREGISRGQAWLYIKNLMVYGLIGLLPKRDWEHCFHPRLWSYLYMFKLGRLEDTINLSLLTERVNSYAAQLGAEPLLKQVVISVLNHFWKNTYYNSGDGEAIATVPLRKALKIAGVTRLHEQWILLPIELEIDLVSPALRSLGGTCWVVLVFDAGSQRPVGFWLSEKPPTSVEAGLALYDAIFHRTALHWPLRGLPEHILIPQELVKGGDNLYQAATFLMAEVATTKDPGEQLKRLPYARQLISDLQKKYEPVKLPGRRRAPRQQLTVHQADDEIRSWLYTRCFPNHRTDPVPGFLKRQGVSLPGYDTPAAGWLLPSVGERETVRHGVEIGHLRYLDSSTAIEPGETVVVRSLPPRLGRIRSIFVEYQQEERGILHWLPLNR